MYVNVSIDASDLEDIDAHDLAELFEDLSTKEQEEFFGIIHKDIKPLERIRAILSNLSNDEALKLLKELNNEFKSDEEWQKTIKSINGGNKSNYKILILEFGISITRVVVIRIANAKQNMFMVKKPKQGYLSLKRIVK